jgi:hypothetical protein
LVIAVWGRVVGRNPQLPEDSEEGATQLTLIPAIERMAQGSY